MKTRIESVRDGLKAFDADADAHSLLEYVSDLLAEGVEFQTSYEYTWQEIAEFNKLVTTH